MATRNNNAAANKVNAPAPATNNTNNASANNAPATPATPAPAPIMDAATIAATAAAWLEKYASIRGIKDNGATLINEHGRDNYNAILTACKATRAAEISTYHADVRGVLNYSAVLAREFDAIRAAGTWGKWCKLVAREFNDAAAFVAACYPHVLADGQPARREYYTNGATIYAAFRPLNVAADKGGAAVDVLCKALDNFKRQHAKHADKANDGGALVLNQVHADGVAYAAFNVGKETKTDASGAKYEQIKRDGRAKIDAATLARINVGKAGKNGGRLLTLAEYNADLRK